MGIISQKHASKIFSIFVGDMFSIIMYQKCSFMEKVIINLKHIHMHNHMHTEHNLDLLQVDLTSF